MEIKDAIQRLNDFYDLEDNWDSYGGAPIAPFAIKRAIELLEGFFVVPVADGTIAITFGKDEDVTIMIDQNGDVYGLL